MILELYPLLFFPRKFSEIICNENPSGDVAKAPGISKTHCLVHKSDGIHMYKTGLMEEELVVIKDYVNVRSCGVNES